MVALDRFAVCVGGLGRARWSATVRQQVRDGFAKAKQRGRQQIPEIARDEARRLGLDETRCPILFGKRYSARTRHRRAAWARQVSRVVRATSIDSGRSFVSSTVNQILSRAVNGERISASECLTLFESANIFELGKAAKAISDRLHPESTRTYNIDRNINYTTCVPRYVTFARSTAS